MIRTHSRPNRPQTAAGLLALALALSACSGVEGSSTETAGSTGGAGSSGAAAPSSCAQTDTPFSTDDAPESAEYGDLATSLGPVPEPAEDVRLGSVMKFLGNQYWATLSKGQTTRADKYGVEVDVQAASSESDQVGQLNASETMLNKGYQVILASPQSDTNMCPAVEKAEAKDLIVVNVNDAVFPNARQWVGPNQIQNGVSAAEHMGTTLPKGSSVAIIQGQAGVYAAKQRTAGFTQEAEEQGLEVVASVPGASPASTPTTRPWPSASPRPSTPRARRARSRSSARTGSRTRTRPSARATSPRRSTPTRT